MLKVTISEESTLRRAIEMLNKIASQMLLVTDDEKKLLGTITDGDIRRAILKGISLDSPVKNIMNNNPKVIMVGYKFDEAKKMFLKYGIKRIPVIDEDKRVVDILYIEDFIKKEEVQKKENYVVMMAGGRGKRLDPLTRIIPKPLIPIGDKSMLEHIIDKFASQGFYKFILTLHYKKEMIKMYIKDLNLPYEINWVEEGFPMGTAGGLSLIMEKFKIDKPAILTNCDVLLDLDFEKVLGFHKEKGASLTIIASYMSYKIPYGILKIKDGFLEKIEEKPSQDILINTGVYVMSPEVFEYIPKNEAIDMPQVIFDLIKSKRKVAVYPYYGEFFDIGQWELYRKIVEKM